MELSEMIKVMQHFADCGEVECVEKGNDNWEIVTKPLWNFDDFEYRIKEPKQKVTIEKWLMQDITDKEYRIIETSLVNTLIHFKKVKLIESYEVEV